MNAPYKKQYDKNGILLNPITKEEPYLHAPHPAFNRKGSFRNWALKVNKFFTGRVIQTY